MNSIQVGESMILRVRAVVCGLSISHRENVNSIGQFRLQCDAAVLIQLFRYSNKLIHLFLLDSFAIDCVVLGGYGVWCLSNLWTFKQLCSH